MAKQAEKKLNNTAFVFLKPHANTEKAREMVKQKLQDAKLKITKEGDISGKKIDEKSLVDNHYYAIASKATLTKAEKLPVPAPKFKEKFGIDWSEAVKQRRVYNAKDACTLLNVDGEGLDKLWSEAGAKGDSVKLGGGFRCCKLQAPEVKEEEGKEEDKKEDEPSSPKSVKSRRASKKDEEKKDEDKKDDDKKDEKKEEKKTEKKPEKKKLPPVSGDIYVFNGFFMSMRAKFTAADASIHYYVVEWSKDDLSWEDFRGQLLGPTDPAEAPADSLRGTFHKDWKDLGLEAACNVGDNAIHASASPLESLAERNNWLNVDVDADGFGKALMAFAPKTVIKSWFKDPQVMFGESPYTIKASMFDTVEDQDTDLCLAYCGMIQGRYNKQDKTISGLENDIDRLVSKNSSAVHIDGAAHAIFDSKSKKAGKKEEKKGDKKGEKGKSKGAR